MTGYKASVAALAEKNSNFRKVLYTAHGGQLVLMSLKAKEEIGMEVHHDVDQFFWIVKGTANTVLDGVEGTVTEGEVLIVPRGTMHNLTNADSRCGLKLFTVYTPPNHPDGTVHKTKADAEAAHHD
jgi:mannose-6-phosphate isomerase-like protein (cupin superfamily)